jgi:hypothetical protein
MVSPCGLGVVSTVAEKMAEWRHDIVQSWNWWRWGSTVERIGHDEGRPRQTQCTTLYVRESNKEKRNPTAPIDPGRTSLLDSEDLNVVSTDRDENVMDDFSILTIREPWLLKKISMSNASAWLAGGKLMLLGRRDLRQETNSTELSKRPLWGKGRLIKEFHNFLYERWLQVGTSKQSCSHLYLLRKFAVFTTHCF